VRERASEWGSTIQKGVPRTAPGTDDSNTRTMAGCERASRHSAPRSRAEVEALLVAAPPDLRRLVWLVDETRSWRMVKRLALLSSNSSLHELENAELCSSLHSMAAAGSAAGALPEVDVRRKGVRATGL